MRELSKGSHRPRAARWLEVIADPIRLGILRSLSQMSEATTADLAARGQASSQTLRRHLDALVSLGVIHEHPAQSDGETPGRPAAHFSLPAEMRESVRSTLELPGPGLEERPRAQAQGLAVAPAAATLVSTNSIAAVGPMNGAQAT